MKSIELDYYDQIAFDLDGVLVSSEDVVETALKRWAIEKGLCPNEVMYKSKARRDVDLVAEILPEASPEYEANVIAEYEVQAMGLLLPIPGAAEFFHSLPVSRRSIVTSSARRSAIKRLQTAGIAIPEVFITADDVEHGKPDPAPYLALLRRRNINPQRCLVFEDSVTGITAAVRAGCDCIGIGAAARGHPDIVGWMDSFRSLSLITRIQVRIDLKMEEVA